MPLERNGFVTGGTWCVDRNKLLAYWPAEGLVALTLSPATTPARAILAPVSGAT